MRAKYFRPKTQKGLTLFRWNHPLQYTSFCSTASMCPISINSEFRLHPLPAAAPLTQKSRSTASRPFARTPFITSSLSCRAGKTLDHSKRSPHGTASAADSNDQRSFPPPSGSPRYSLCIWQCRCGRLAGGDHAIDSPPGWAERHAGHSHVDRQFPHLGNRQLSRVLGARI